MPVNCSIRLKKLDSLTHKWVCHWNFGPGTNFFVENFGSPGLVFLKIMVRSRNFGPPSHSIVMIYTKGFYLHAIKFN